MADKSTKGGGYTVLARKYRPRRFDDLIGQPHVVKALSNALATGRLAQAFLFTGSRGTGKTTSARLLASALNCSARGDEIEPCGECPSCVGITAGEDLDVVEMDAASNSRVDDIRERLDSIDTRPSRGKYRVFIIDEVHMLSASAFNALLKTVEEPPAHVKFILATTNPEKIPETILSRVQRYDFRRVTLSEIVARLESIAAQEGIKPGDGLLRSLAEMAEGGVRDALGKLDQLVAFAGESPTVEDAERVFGLVSRKGLLELLEALSKGDAARGINFAEEVFDGGKDVAEVLAALIGLTRQLMIVEASGGDGRALDLPPDDLPLLKRVGGGFGLIGLVYLAELLTDCRQRVRRAAFARVVVEATFVKLSMIGKLESIETLVAELDSGAEGIQSAREPGKGAKSQNSGKEITPAGDKKGEPESGNGLKQMSENEAKAIQELKRKFGAR